MCWTLFLSTWTARIVSLAGAVYRVVLFKPPPNSQDPRSAEVEALRGDAQEQGLEASDQDPFVEAEAFAGPKRNEPLRETP